MEIEVNNKKYELIKNYKEAFDEEDFINKCTEYFYDYDYIVGDSNRLTSSSLHFFI